MAGDGERRPVGSRIRERLGGFVLELKRDTVPVLLSPGKSYRQEKRADGTVEWVEVDYPLLRAINEG